MPLPKLDGFEHVYSSGDVMFKTRLRSAFPLSNLDSQRQLTITALCEDNSDATTMTLRSNFRLWYFLRVIEYILQSI
jgi:hypothetical protein